MACLILKKNRVIKASLLAIKVGLQVGQLIMKLHQIATESFHLLLTP
jgi:hypothetical protein